MPELPGKAMTKARRAVTPVNPELLAWLGTVKQYLSRDGYYVVYPNGHPRPVHRLVWEAYHGPAPKGMAVHHVNHKKTDNRIVNLQLMDSREHTSRHMRHADRKYDRRPSYEQLSKDGMCVSCARRPAPNGSAHCSVCAETSRKSCEISTVRNKWRAEYSLRSCPKCGAQTDCAVPELVCDPCIELHLRVCPLLPGPSAYYGKGIVICAGRDNRYPGARCPRYAWGGMSDEKWTEILRKIGAPGCINARSCQ